MAYYQTRISKGNEAYTVAVVCANDFEVSAVRSMFDEEHQRMPNKPEDPNHYILGKLSGHDTVLAWCPRVRSENAVRTVAANIGKAFPSIQWRFLTGIGGGVPDTDDIRLGDVVVGVPAYNRRGGLVQYDIETDADNGSKLKCSFSTPPTKLINDVSMMKSNHLGRGNRIEEFIKEMLKRDGGRFNYQRPPSTLDVLFAAGYPHVPGNQRRCESCDAEHVLERSNREYGGPQIHYGLIASSRRVMENTFQRDSEAQNIGGDVLCFDMEAAGLDTDFECLVIRGISDYADSHKNGVWKYYAAAAAAACTKEILTLIRTATGSHHSGHNTFIGSGIQNTGNMTIHGDYSLSC
ncbi:nucleoside phosphorylase domain-containing protein [Nemania abortiva]|nr:nucleoside phosphorylase domain-containing protein [Nemania abortiva]